MSKYETVEVPTLTLADGRYFITDMAVRESDAIRDFIGHFSNYWQRHEYLDGWASPPKEVA